MHREYLAGGTTHSGSVQFHGPAREAVKYLDMASYTDIKLDRILHNNRSQLELFTLQKLVTSFDQHYW